MGPNDRCFSHGLVNTELGTVQPPNVIDAPKAIQSPVAAYLQVSNIRRTKSQHLKDSRPVLWLSLPDPLKPDVKSRMKM